MRIVAYDPSFINLGVAFGISTPNGVDLHSAQTYKIDQLLNKIGVKHDWDTSDNRKRMLMVGRVLHYTLNAFSPDIVVLEDPIYNKRNPDSLITQSRCLGVLEQTIERYFQTRQVAPITNFKPNVIKLGVGVPKGRFNDKEAITERLEHLMQEGVLRYTDKTMVPQLSDDHTNDAVAMVFTKHLEVQHELA